MFPASYGIFFFLLFTFLSHVRPRFLILLLFLLLRVMLLCLLLFHPSFLSYDRYLCPPLSSVSHLSIAYHTVISQPNPL